MNNQELKGRSYRTLAWLYCFVHAPRSHRVPLSTFVAPAKTLSRHYSLRSEISEKEGQAPVEEPCLVQPSSTALFPTKLITIVPGMLAINKSATIRIVIGQQSFEKTNPALTLLV
jgi:hypothetical protein